jgi:hypothetical protein
VPGRERAEQRHVAAAARAEAEVVANQHPARGQRADEHFLDEALRGERSKSPVKALHMDAIDAVRLEQLELLAQRREPRRRSAGARPNALEVLARMGLEGQHAALQAAPGGLGAHALQDRLVPPVDTIEVAYGQRDGNGDGATGAAGHQHGESGDA